MTSTSVAIEADAERQARSAATWNAVAGGWARFADRVDEAAGGITERLLALAALEPGDRVLELACGPGGAGLAAAQWGAGEVVLSDISPEMVAAAGRRAEALGLDNVSARTLDLERIAEPDAAYDVVLCREGLMFAGDAVRAATDIRRVLRRGGRVAVSVWADRGANPWLGIVGHAFSAELGRPASQAGPNPFALGDPDRLGAVLSEAGFRDVAVEPLSVPRRAASVDAWWQWVTALAPIAQALAALPEATAERIRARACEAAAVYTTEDGLEIPGLALIASGRSFG